MLASAMRMKRFTKESVALLNSTNGSSPSTTTAPSIAADPQRAERAERRTDTAAAARDEMASVREAAVFMRSFQEGGPAAGRPARRGRRGGRRGWSARDRSERRWTG